MATRYLYPLLKLYKIYFLDKSESLYSCILCFEEGKNLIDLFFQFFCLDLSALAVIHVQPTKESKIL